MRHPPVARGAPWRRRALGWLCCGAALAGPAGAAELTLADAVQRALAGNPAIAVQVAQRDAADGRAQQAAGQFDWNLHARVDYERLVTPLRASALASGTAGQASDHRMFTTGYQLGLDKQLRNGLLLASALSASSKDEASALAGRAPLAVSKLELALTVPLLQGRGGAGARDTEQAARLQAQARRHDLLDRTARTVHDTLLGYWTYRTRADLEAVAASSEQRSADLLRSFQKLVDASEKPRADLVLLQADLADKAGAREAARLALSDARTALGRMLGLDAGAISALGAARDELPVAPALTPTAAARLAMLALERRPDAQSLTLQLAALRHARDAAVDAGKARLDLSMGLAQTKVGDGGGRYRFIGEAGRSASAPSLFAHLNLQLAVENNSAHGAVRERAALLSELTVRQRDLHNGVTSGVDSALRALASSALQLEAARTALAMYEQAVAQEMIKQSNGISTLIDVINTEARFVNARVNFLQARLAHAGALARLRLESGTLLAAVKGERVMLDLAGLSDLPALAEPSTTSP